MASKSVTYSSVHLRERDKVLEEKHQQELAFLESKLERQRRSNDRTLQQVYHVQNRLDALSRNLGFRDAYEAEMAIDTADMSFKECLNHMLALKTEVEGVQELKEKLQVLEEESATLKKQLEDVERERNAESKEARRSKKDLEHMKEQYDALLDLKERAAERFKKDYKRWRGFKTWLFDEHDEALPSIGIEIADIEGKKKEKKSVDRRKMQVRACCGHPPLGNTDVILEDDEDDNKENHDQDTPVSERTKHRVSGTPPSAISTPLQPSTKAGLLRQSKFSSPAGTEAGLHSLSSTTATATLKNSNLKSITNIHTVPSSSPTVFLSTSSGNSTSTRIPLSFEPLPNTQPKIKREPQLSPERLYPAYFPTAGRNDRHVDIANSSDTEEDSQAPDLTFSFQQMAAAPRQTGGVANATFKLPYALASQAEMHNSSDTEEDSQAPETTLSYHQIAAVPASRRTTDEHSRVDTHVTATFKLPSPLIPAAWVVGSSNIEVESRAPPAESKAPSSRLSAISTSSAQAPSSSSRPSAAAGSSGPSRSARLSSFPQISPDVKRRRKSDIESASRMRQEEDERARKVRRVTGSEFEGITHNRAHKQKENGVDMDGPVRTGQGTTVAVGGAHRGTPRVGVPETEKGKSAKGKGRDTETLITSRDRGKRHLEDYSAFKGRGRYAKDAANSGNKTINAMYAIDTSKNNGLEYAYDEVVRGREQRKKMDGGDCECCRDYYEAVGPLPSRLQQPLWRSPSPKKYRHLHSASSPMQEHSLTAHSARPSHDDVESHKKAISRHRQTWTRAATPPGYWDIGFPNTQEVGNINEKAEEMHRRKRKEVEGAAEKEGGPWKRR